MQDAQFDTKQMQAIAKIPFLAEFPYPEYSFKHEMLKGSHFGDANSTNEMYETVLFSHADDPKTFIYIAEKDLWHLYDIRDNVKKLDEISKIVSHGIASDSILELSIASKKAEAWFKEVKGKNFNVGSGTFNDILNGYAGSGKVKSEFITRLANITNRLYKGSGIVYMKPDEKTVLLKYYKFQLIYYKMLIGIIIATKIHM